MMIHLFNDVDERVFKNDVDDDVMTVMTYD